MPRGTRRGVVTAGCHRRPGRPKRGVGSFRLCRRTRTSLLEVSRRRCTTIPRCRLSPARTSFFKRTSGSSLQRGAIARNAFRGPSGGSSTDTPCGRFLRLFVHSAGIFSRFRRARVPAAGVAERAVRPCYTVRNGNNAAIGTGLALSVRHVRRSSRRASSPSPRGSTRPSR